MIGTNGKRHSGTKFISPGFCLPFTQTVNQPVCPCKWDSPSFGTNLLPILMELWTLSIQPKLSKNMETAANGTEISGKGSRNSKNCWISETRKHLTKNSRNSRSKVEWKENFRENCFENWGIPREVVLFLEILENVIPFANGSCWKFKADVLVEWKAPYA